MVVRNMTMNSLVEIICVRSFQGSVVGGTDGNTLISVIETIAACNRCVVVSFSKFEGN